MCIIRPIMRDDLNKQLCERERWGSDMKYRTARRAKKYNPPLDEDGENTRSHESMTFRHENTKEFNENLKPLYGALRKAVGRPWDKFYSELCQKFNMRSVINQHILQHLEQYCERDIVVEDGELYVRAYSMALEPLRDSHYTEFYVDPRTGIIRKNKWHKGRTQRAKEDRAKAAKREAAKFRQLDDKNVLHFVDDVWYHFTLEKIPHGKEVVGVKPPGVEFFTDYRNQQKIWDKLRDFDKERLGLRKFEGKRVKDVMTEKVLYHDGTKVCEYNNRFYRHDLGDMYHASKKTASHKILKKAGLVK